MLHTKAKDYRMRFLGLLFLPIMAYSTIDLQLTLPPKIYCNPITSSSLYYNNTILNSDSEAYSFIMSPVVGMVDSIKYTFQPQLLNSGRTEISISVYDSLDELVASETTQIEFIGNEIMQLDTTKLLVIGNSLTAEGVYMTHLNSLLVDTLNYPVRFLGTNGSSGLNHEGHPGRTWEWFCKMSGGSQSAPLMGS